MPSEIFFHQLQTAGAFSVLGFLIPSTALIISNGKSDRRFLKSIVLLIALSLLIAISTSWMMHARLSSLSAMLIELEATNPGIPAQSHYSMISLYRIATYPGIFLIMIIVFNLLKAYRIKQDNDNNPDMTTPKKPSG